MFCLAKMKSIEHWCCKHLGTRLAFFNHALGSWGGVLSVLQNYQCLVFCPCENEIHLTLVLQTSAWNRICLLHLVRFYLCFIITWTRYFLNYIELEVDEICGVGPLFVAFRLQNPEDFLRTDQIGNCLICCCGTTQVTDIFIVL